MQLITILGAILFFFSSWMSLTYLFMCLDLKYIQKKGDCIMFGFIGAMGFVKLIAYLFNY